MVHLDEDGFGQVVHDVGVFVVFEAGAEQIEAFFRRRCLKIRW